MIRSTDADDVLAAARLRGRKVRDRILAAEGGVLSPEQVAAHLHSTTPEVEQLRRSGRVLALSVGGQSYRYPSWQFAPEGLLPGFELVLGDLRGHDAWMQALFFLNGNEYLDGASPLAELRCGQIDRVRRAARAYGEHGAA
ncbi:MAG TPA: hypothetical protein VFE37_20600 [Chloroflexota bacterium]|nr:hypothetical protein [Chloroflexota bacterium]